MLRELEKLQYSSLRDEIGRLQEQNEKLFERAMLVFAAAWSVFAVAPLFLESFLPSMFLLGAGALSVVSLSRYTANSKRVANIGSFISVAYSGSLTAQRNWELQISSYSQRAKVDLSSPYSVRFFYLAVIRVAVYVSLMRLANVTVGAEMSFANLVSFLFVAGSIVAVSLLSHVIDKRHIAYPELRSRLDEYWQGQHLVGEDEA